MRNKMVLKCAALLFAASAGGLGCFQFPFPITGLVGSFDPATNPATDGLDAGDPFEAADVRIPTGDLNIDQLIEDAQNEIGGIAQAVSLNAILVESLEFDADEGSSFGFVTSIEILFLPEGEPESAAETLLTASGPLSDQETLTPERMIDLLAFVSGENAGGEIIIRMDGITPDATQTWLMTVNLILVLGLGS